MIAQTDNGATLENQRNKKVHATNLALRLLLELMELSGFAILAWNLTDGLWRYVAAVAALWPGGERQQWAELVGE